MNNRSVFANLSVRVPPEILDELHQQKLVTGKSLNQMVVEALQAYIAAQQRGGKDPTK